MTLLFVVCLQDWIPGAIFGSASGVCNTCDTTSATSIAVNQAYLQVLIVLIIASRLVLFRLGISAAAPQSLVGPVQATPVRWTNKGWSRPVLFEPEFISGSLLIREGLPVWLPTRPAAGKDRSRLIVCPGCQLPLRAPPSPAFLHSQRQRVGSPPCMQALPPATANMVTIP